jgi:hypothetical protein
VDLGQGTLGLENSALAERLAASPLCWAAGLILFSLGLYNQLLHDRSVGNSNNVWGSFAREFELSGLDELVFLYLCSE